MTATVAAPRTYRTAMYATNRSAAAHYAAEVPQDAIPDVWTLTYQIKAGRRWISQQDGFLDYEARKLHKANVMSTYGKNVRNFEEGCLLLRESVTREF